MKRQMVSKKEGSAMVGVLAALVFVGIVGTFMVANTKTQSATSSGYSTVQTLGSTVTSSLVATEQYLRLRSSSALTAINAARTNPQWLIGGAGSKESLPNSNNQKINTKILNFDNTTFIASIEGNGYGSGSEPKKTRAVYRLAGIQRLTVPGSVNSPAIYANSGFTNVNDSLRVNTGDFFLRGQGNFNNKVSVDGNLIVRASGFDNMMANISAKNALFEGNIGLNSGTRTITGKAGFLANTSHDGTTNVTDSIFRKTNFSPNNGTVNSAATITNASLTYDQLANKMGIPTTDNVPTATLTSIPADRIDTLSNITGWNNKINTDSLNRLYNSRKAAGLLTGGTEGLLVIRITQSAQVAATAANAFNGKILFIVEAAVTRDGTGKYNGTSTSNSMFYVRGSNGCLQNFGGDFRGYIHNDGTNNNGNFEGIKLRGSIHSKTAKINLNSGGGGMNVTGDGSVLSDFVQYGVVVPAAGTVVWTTTDEVVLQTGVSTITPVLLGSYYY